MAAFWRAATAGRHVVDLRALHVSQMRELLEEEVWRWRASLHWDFRPSADLVERYVTLRALDGVALVDDEEVLGYSYWVLEDRKALLGDLFIRDTWRTPDVENLLLTETLERLRASKSPGWLRRIEAQLMQVSVRGEQLLPRGPQPRVYARLFMLGSLASVENLRTVQCPDGMEIVPWRHQSMDEAASLIASVYRHHVDSEINDQYRTAAGARRFLQNIVQYPGCGRFSASASWLAVDAEGAIRGLAVGTRVSEECGHLAQICVTPELQGSGLAYELLRRTLAALRSEGARELSLTVTMQNERAVRLYQRFGFRTIHSFDAWVWDGI